MILRLLLSSLVGLTFVTASYAAIEDQISEFMLDNGIRGRYKRQSNKKRKQQT